jgi:cytochrome c peroxidase
MKTQHKTCGLAAVAFFAAAVAPAAWGQSLKTVPSNQDLIDLLKHPGAVQGPRTLFPGLAPLPPLDVHPLTVNTFTAQPLLVDPNDPFAISFDIPALGRFPFVGGLPDRPLEVPLNETDFIVDRVAAVQLGKALFWDMQVGSDGVQACGSCHFHAGADNRVKNSLNPGVNAGDSTLQVKPKNQSVDASDFPFHKLANPNIQGEPLLNPANVLRDSNDVLSSMGVVFRQFVDIPTPGAGAFVPGTNPPVLMPDVGNALPDPVGAVFQGVRRVEPRNTPSFFAAANNFDNFWDGRARHDFNGGSPFGASDPFSHIFVDDGSGLQATRQLIRMSSMASLATGPALSNFEMSFDKRYWAKVGKKLLQSGAVPLANQLVDPNDSALGLLSNQRITPGMPGLSVTYAQLIQQAFGGRLWSNTSQHLDAVADPSDAFDGVALGIGAGAASPTNTTQFTQMEANFSLFFGLSVQAYTQILEPNDSPFDRFHDANPNEFLGIVQDIDPVTPGVQVVGLTTHQLFGYDLFQRSNLSRLNPFLRSGSCSICHFAQELTEHSIRSIQNVMPPDIVTGADKVLSGYMLENALRGPAKIAIEMDGINQTLDGNGAATGIALVDKGVYNIGVRPIPEDIGRGANDPFGLPMSLAALALRNAGYPVGAFRNQVPPVPALPPWLMPFANDFPIGLAFPNINQPLFLPDVVSPTSDIFVSPSGTFPNPNRVARMGSFKVPQLKNVELTGPYFHNGGQLTLRQVVDFYSRGGDFPITNASDRDPLIVDLHVNFGALFTDADKAALVDFLLSLTDDRVRFERAPFDHPEIIVPVDGTAPDNTAGRAALLADSRFTRIPESGAAGNAIPLAGFLNVSSVAGSAGPDQFDVVTTAPLPNMLLSFSSTTALPGLGIVTNHDIVRFNSATNTYSMVFRGASVGLTTQRISAFTLLPSGDILMSFAASTAVPGLVGGPARTTVTNADIVRFHPTSLGASTAGTFNFYFDGSDVGLTTTSENIDAISLDASGNLLLSLGGAGAATGLNGIQDEDVVRFTATSLGSITTGSFSMFFKGSNVGLSTTAGEDVDAAFLAPDGRLYLSTLDLFNVPGATGTKSSILRFTPSALGAGTAGTFELFASASQLGLPTTANIDGIVLLP